MLTLMLLAFTRELFGFSVESMVWLLAIPAEIFALWLCLFLADRQLRRSLTEEA